MAAPIAIPAPPAFVEPTWPPRVMAEDLEAHRHDPHALQEFHITNVWGELRRALEMTTSLEVYIGILRQLVDRADPALAYWEQMFARASFQANYYRELHDMALRMNGPAATHWKGLFDRSLTDERRHEVSGWVDWQQERYNLAVRRARHALSIHYRLHRGPDTLYRPEQSTKQ